MSPETFAGDQWLADNGPLELEMLLASFMVQPATAAILADSERRCRGISAGAARMLAKQERELLGRQFDDFLEPGATDLFVAAWPAFLDCGQANGELLVTSASGSQVELKYSARANILPGRHLLVVWPTAPASGDDRDSRHVVEDYGLSLLDTNGAVVAWYSGAERMNGYAAADVLGKPPPGSPAPGDLLRSASDGHTVREEWQVRRDGSRYWGNVLTAGLRDHTGELRGFARVVRDFTGRRDFDEHFRRKWQAIVPGSEGPAVSAVAIGEFDQLREANDLLLDVLGYSHDDLRMGRLSWPALTPPEYVRADDWAHEEQLRYGACTPYVKELISKSGRRISVLVATAMLKLYPFRWIALVQDLGGPAGNQLPDEREPESANRFEEIVGNSSAVKRLLAQVESVAPTGATVLILGETGTGKELIARAVHKLSRRSRFPFVTLNCAAIPTGLLESELFGYEKGAFTGALQQKIGRFEMAHRGTLFLDEVGDIPLEIQPKLLRALQERCLERLGGTRTIPIDVRLVAATNRNLNQMMGDRLFRPDLYYRLKVFPVVTPPLRDHPEDIPLLVRHFTRKYAAIMERQIDTITPETMRVLTTWSWPGNVRELENFIERAVILSGGSVLRAPLAELRADSVSIEHSGTLEQVERDHIIRVVRACGGVITAAALRLGIPRTTLNAMMRKLGISRKDL